VWRGCNGEKKAPIDGYEDRGMKIEAFHTNMSGGAVRTIWRHYPPNLTHGSD